MASLRDTMQKMVNLSEDAKLDIILENCQELMPTLRKMDSKTHGLVFLAAIMSTAITADGKLHVKEAAIFKALMKAVGVTMSDEEVVKMIVSMGKQGTYDAVKALANALDANKKANLVMMVAGICSLDDRVSPEELSYIDDLI